MRWIGPRAMASRRSSDRARWAPRLVATIAWISSRITVWMSRRTSRALDVSSRYSDSGVVIRMSAGRRWKRARSAAGVSPVRMATSGTWWGRPSSRARRLMPASGARRFRSTSTARAFSGEMYSTRHRSRVSGGGSNISRLMHHRKPVSVLPLPVGASSRVLAPVAMTGQPWTWGAVGSGNEVSNHRATTGWNGSRAEGRRGSPRTAPVDPVLRRATDWSLAPSARGRPFRAFRAFCSFRPVFRLSSHVDHRPVGRTGRTDLNE